MEYTPNERKVITLMVLTLISMMILLLLGMKLAYQAGKESKPEQTEIQPQPGQLYAQPKVQRNS